MASWHLSKSERLCLLIAVLSLLWRSVVSDYYPVYGRGATIHYNASIDYRRFPDVQHTIPDTYNYFLSDLNFDVADGKIVCGAADKLYVLDSVDLTEETSLTWEPDTSKKTACESDVSESPDYNCRNHIRVHMAVPTVTDGASLLVCGTQATRTSECRVVRVEDDGESLESFTSVDASPGIVSYYPDFSQFGEFRRENETDMTYFSAGFFSGTSGIGRHFSISYQTISVSDDPNTLTTMERFRTINANNNWLRYPVTFVDYLRLDYTPLEGGHEYDYQLYFAFIRENLYSAATSSDDIIQSRVVRICRNDPGYNDPGSTDLPYFTTYMKARIFCERQLESGDKFDGGIKYLYNELRSVAFTEGGRYYVDGDYGKKLYGAFTGPIVGPHGTAICVYSAENTKETGRNGRSQSMFDIFREDLQSPQGSQMEHNFLECNPAGRSMEDAQNILINEEKFVDQLSSDPLIVMDGTFVNQMVLDRQCVVKKDDGGSCVSQDILYLGTDSGKVLKVVFASGSSGIFPVVAEEISLDDGNNIEKMVIHEDGAEPGERYLFVNTHSKIYKFPLARCSRHQTCIDCVSARDPYCVWDGDTNMCISNPFSAEQSGDVAVDSQRYKQNIHSGDGDTAACMAESDCHLMTSAADYNIIQVDASCTNTDQIRVAVTPSEGLTVTNPIVTLVDDTGSTTITGSDGLQSYTVQVTAMQTGSSQETLLTSVVTTPPGPPVDISTDNVLIDSATSTSFRVTLHIKKFTDYFDEYSFKVEGDVASEYQSFTTSTSYTVTDLTPATQYTFTVVLRNSIDMVMTGQLSARTLDDVPSAVQSLAGSPSMTSIMLTWSAPATTNGDIVGYVVRVGGGEGVEVRGCAGWGDAMETSYDVGGLTPSTEYRFQVAACTSAGEGPSVSMPVTTLCSSPEQVTSLQFDTITSDSLHYTWSSPTVVNGVQSMLDYTVFTTCYRENGTVTGTPTVAAGAQTEGSITGLPPVTLCCVRVAARNNCPGQAPLSGPLSEVCTETDDVIPGAVRSLTVAGVNREGILVTWNPPANYERSGLEYSITVTAPNFDTVMDTKTDQGYYYLGSLEASKGFTVTVSARSGEGEGAAKQAVVSTLPDAPPPPSNPRLSVVNATAVTLELSWDSVDTDVYQVTGYMAVMRCNEDVLDVKTTMSQNTSVTFDVMNPGSSFTWCTAQVQTENAIGLGQFSDLVSIAVPSLSPSTPRCYLVDDQGSAVFISFDVTHPFSLDSLEIRYRLIADFQEPDSVQDKSVLFTSSNMLTLNVSRNTRYEFQLRLCNTRGCSDYCRQLSNFTTSSTAPRPPSDITVTAITHNSASLHWSIPDFENASAIDYIIQVTSSGSADGVFIREGHETSLEITNLDPETMYAVAIQVRDRVTGTDGMFGPAESFSTESGTPSQPVGLEVKWTVSRLLLSVSWGVPNTKNGTIRGYELLYTGLQIVDGEANTCEAPGEKAVIADSLGPTNRSFETQNTSNLVESKSIFVCVRAYTDKPGIWAPFVIKEIDVDPLTSTDEQSSESNCNGLIAVAVVAGVAVMSTILAAVVLFVVLRRSNNQVMDHKSSQSGLSTDDHIGTNHRSPSPSRGSNDTGFDERPAYQTQESNFSTGSTNTLRQLLPPNGK